MEKESESTDFKWRRSHQYYAAIAANLIMLGHGCIMGWFSPALPRLLSENTPLVASGPLNSVDVSWIGSIPSIGAMCGSSTFGFFITLLGCKRVMICLVVPSTLFWILVYFGDAYHHILLARFFTGWTASGVQCTIILYISEISNDDIRGKLGSITQAMRSLGILIGYVVGAVVDYEYIPCIFVAIPLMYVVCFAFLPNTPQYYLRKNQTQEAQDALKYYKGYEGKTDGEIAAFTKEFDRLQSISTEQQKDHSLRISDFTTRESLKGMIIGLALAYFSQMCGCFAIITYAVYIVEHCGTTLDPYKSSIALAVMLIMGNLCTTQVADKLGRKTFLIISILGCAAGHMGLSAFLYLSSIGYDLSRISWIPIACLAFVVFVASAGVVPITHICRVENLPTKIRTVGLSICIFVLNLTAFTSTKLFPILLESIGLHWCMMIFCINCIVGSVFIFFVIDETKGKPMDSLKSEPNRTETSNC